MLEKQLYQNKAEKEGKRIEGENLKKKKKQQDDRLKFSLINNYIKCKRTAYFS